MNGWLLAVVGVAVALTVVLLVFGRTKTVTAGPAKSPETTLAVSGASSNASKAAPRAGSTAGGFGPLVTSDGFLGGATSPRAEIGDSPSAETAVLETAGQGSALDTAGQGDGSAVSEGFVANLFAGVGSFFENLGFDFDGDGDGDGGD